MIDFPPLAAQQSHTERVSLAIRRLSIREDVSCELRSWITASLLRLITLSTPVPVGNSIHTSPQGVYDICASDNFFRTISFFPGLVRRKTLGCIRNDLAKAFASIPSLNR